MFSHQQRPGWALSLYSGHRALQELQMQAALFWLGEWAVERVRPLRSALTSGASDSWSASERTAGLQWALHFRCQALAMNSPHSLSHQSRSTRATAWSSSRTPTRTAEAELEQQHCPAPSSSGSARCSRRRLHSRQRPRGSSQCGSARFYIQGARVSTFSRTRPLHRSPHSSDALLEGVSYAHTKFQVM